MSDFESLVTFSPISVPKQYHPACQNIDQCFRLRSGTVFCSKFDTLNMTTVIVSSTAITAAQTISPRGCKKDAKER